MILILLITKYLTRYMLVTWYMGIKISIFLLILPKIPWKLHVSTIFSQMLLFFEYVVSDCEYFQNSEGELTLWNYFILYDCVLTFFNFWCLYGHLLVYTLACTRNERRKFPNWTELFTLNWTELNWTELNWTELNLYLCCFIQNSFRKELMTLRVVMTINNYHNLFHCIWCC